MMDAYPRSTDWYLGFLLSVLISRHVYTGSSSLFISEFLLVVIATGLRFRSRLALVASWAFSIFFTLAILNWGIQMTGKGIEEEAALIKYAGLFHVLLAVGASWTVAHLLFSQSLSDYISGARVT